METKVAICVRIKSDLMEKIRDIVFWTPGKTVSSLTQELYQNLVDAIEQNDPKVPIRKRTGGLSRGLHSSNRAIKVCEEVVDEKS